MDTLTRHLHVVLSCELHPRGWRRILLYLLYPYPGLLCKKDERGVL